MGRSAEYLDRRRARAQAGIIVRLAAIDEFEVALAACREMDDSDWRGLSLARLAGVLPAHLLDQAVELTLALPRDRLRRGEYVEGVNDTRTAALYALARAVNRAGRTVDAFAITDELTDGRIRRELRGELIGDLVTLSPSDLAPVWRRSLRRLGDLPRADVAEDLVVFRPVMLALGDRSTVDAVAHSLDQVLAWWALSPATLERGSLSGPPAGDPGTRGSWRVRPSRSSRGTA